MCTKSVVMPLFSHTIFTLAYQLFSRNCQEAFSWAFPKKQQQKTIQQNLFLFDLWSFGWLYKTKHKILFVLIKISITHFYRTFWFSAVTISINNKDKTKKEQWVLRFPEWWNVLWFFKNRLKGWFLGLFRSGFELCFW